MAEDGTPGEDDGDLRKRLDEIRLEYGGRIVSVFEDDEFPRLEQVVNDLRERETVARSHVAGVHKLYAYLANERPTLSDLADQYDISERAVQNGMNYIQDCAGVDIDTRGAPQKLRDHAVVEAQDLFDDHVMDKMEAAEHVAEQYRVGVEQVRQQLSGEARHRFTKQGITEDVGQLLSRRPQTNRELQERLDLPRPASRYTRYLTADCIHTDAGHRVYVWYVDGDEATADLYATVLEAAHAASDEQWYEDVLEQLERRMDEQDWLPEEHDWRVERETMYADMMAAKQENPQRFAALQYRMDGIMDALVSYDLGGNRCYARDVATYLDVDEQSEVRELGKALAVLEDDAQIISSYGRPRTYEQDTYREEDIFLVSAVVNRLEQEQ